MHEKIRVFLADDHPVTREGIKKIVEQAGDIELIGEAADGKEALRLADELKPDVLLLDMEMPGMKGLEVAQKLKLSKSPVCILALSAYDDRHYIRGLLSAGASGYLIKDEIPGDIIDAIRGVARGEQGWVSRKVAAVMAEWTQNGKKLSDTLTPRGKQVLQLVVDGMTNQEIAYQLRISQKTVEKHLESVYSRLNVSSRVEAAVLAVREHIFEK